MDSSYTEWVGAGRSYRNRVILIISLSIPVVLCSCGRQRNLGYAIPGLSSISPESELVRQARDTYYRLPVVEGPAEASPKPVEAKAELRRYSGGSDSRFCVLVTDPRSSWLGLAHGFKSIGIPFTMTDSVDAALRHRVLLVYPGMDRRWDADTLRKFENHVVRGGTLLAVHTTPTNPRWEQLFGFRTLVRSSGRYELSYADSEYAAALRYPEDRTIRINNPESRRYRMRLISFRNAREVLGTYDDGSAALIRNRSGAGTAIAFGWDLGRYIKRAQNNRDHEANRTYVNDYEPSVDSVLRFLMEIYRSGEPRAVTLHPAPDGQALSVVISHDVDYAGSLANSLEYARYQRSAGYGATYFMQTKYFRDFFDEMFFDENTPALLAELEDLGMELASHSVSHSDMFARLPVGNYRESYPRYQPRIVEFFYTRDASIMGELRVSKHLLESLSRSVVVSFRPGFLANPFALPQSLETAGYRYSSTVTANDVMTHLPFRQTFDRLYDAETGIFEFPIAVEDEKDPPMDGRLDAALALAEKISVYGGLFVVLIHPNVTAEKLRFLQGLTERLRAKAWWGTLQEFGGWWAARDAVEADVEAPDGNYRLRLTAPRPVAGLTLELPQGLEAVGSGGIEPETRGRFTIIDLPTGTSYFQLRPRAEPAQRPMQP